MIRLEKTTYLGNNKKAFQTPEVVVNYTEYTKKVSEAWHYHTSHHITLIIQGGNCEQRKKSEFDAVPGTIIFYPSGLAHKNRNTAHPSRNINIEVDESFLNKYDLHFLDRPSGQFIKEKFSILKIYKECLNNDELSQLSIENLLFDLLHAHEEPLHLRNKNNWAKKIKEILHDRWNESITLNEISAALNIHPVHISKFFPKHFGCTLGDYLRRIKIDRALNQLKTSDHSLTEIACLCGFFDQSHFIRTFKKETGFLPKEYREL